MLTNTLQLRLVGMSVSSISMILLLKLETFDISPAETVGQLANHAGFVLVSRYWRFLPAF